MKDKQILTAEKLDELLDNFCYKLSPEERLASMTAIVHGIANNGAMASIFAEVVSEIMKSDKPSPSPAINLLALVFVMGQRFEAGKSAKVESASTTTYTYDELTSSAADKDFLKNLKITLDFLEGK